MRVRNLMVGAMLTFFQIIIRVDVYAGRYQNISGDTQLGEYRCILAHQLMLCSGSGVLGM